MKIVSLLFLLTICAFAHKLNLFIYEENSKVIASTYFASGTYCNGCKIEVYDQDGKLLEKGLTNKAGEYIVKQLKPKLVIKAEAMGGHGAQSEFEVKNLKEEKPEVKDYNLIEAIIAIVLLVLIFIGLKRIKK
ncbi:hypothetical protein ACMC56_13770 [Campylobacterota bacterium DY0563]